MCGIAGLIGTRSTAAVEGMTAALRHRGPDDCGVRTWPEWPLALGHRRLAIIDLSAAGRQPMAYADDRCHIVFNGEIYNYRELRRELEALGYTFRTGADTEVIPAAYLAWGTDCLHRFRGMFAFALADRDTRTVFLARDRFGIKPLYYTQADGGLAFASELRAFTSAELVARQADRQALWDFLSLGSVAQPRTILADVAALMPGHAMMVAADGTVARQWRWWSLREAAARAVPDAAGLGWDTAVRRLREELDTATRYHLVADVPVGAFLSGGVDSAAMVGLMNRQVDAPIRTFTVGFEAAHAEFSELDAAAQTARALGTIHQDVIVRDRDIDGIFTTVLEALDQPSMDGTNTYLVARAAAEHVKVALTGLGGDELFAGYPHFRRHLLAARLRRALPGRVSTAALARTLPDRFRHNLLLPLLDATQRAATLRCLMYESGKRQVTTAAFRRDWEPMPLDVLYENMDTDGLDPVAAVSLCELSGYMVNTLLRDADAMSMAHALELRPVLLDHRLAEFAFALPAAFKLRGGRGKAAFAAALADVLPEGLARRPKRGFELPLLRWLAGPLRERARAAFAGAAAHALFTDSFRREADARLADPRPRDFRLWPYTVLLAWLDANRVTV